MIRTTFLFLGTFVAGALIALVARAALFRPHADHQSPPPVGGAYAPMVTNALAPTAAAGASAGMVPAVSQPPAVSAGTPPAHAASKSVNTICAICGMEVDPKLPTAQYQGKTIGFGCRMCPPKFQADPDRYGPYYLRNEVYPK